MVIISDDEDADFIESDEEEEKNSEDELTDSDDDTPSKTNKASLVVPSNTASSSSSGATTVVESDESRDKRLMEWKNKVISSTSQMSLAKPLELPDLEEQPSAIETQEWVPDIIDLPKTKKKLQEEAIQLAEGISCLRESQNTTVVVLEAPLSLPEDPTPAPTGDGLSSTDAPISIEITEESVSEVEKVFPSLGRPMIVAALGESKNNPEAAIELLLGSEFSKSEAETPEQANESNLLARSLKLDLRKSLHIAEDDEDFDELVDDGNDEWEGKSEVDKNLNKELQDIFRFQLPTGEIKVISASESEILEDTISQTMAELKTRTVMDEKRDEEDASQFQSQFELTDDIDDLDDDDDDDDDDDIASDDESRYTTDSSKNVVSVSSSSSSSSSSLSSYSSSYGVPGSTLSKKERRLHAKRQKFLQNQIKKVGESSSIFSIFKKDKPKDDNSWKELNTQHVPYDAVPQRAYLGLSKANLNVLSLTSYGSVIQNILSPTLALRFEKRWKSFRKKYGKDSEYGNPTLAFHGTSTASCASIIKKGLIIPGWFNGVTKINGSAYGKGIYCSPNVTTAEGYARGRLLVLAVLPGRYDDGYSWNPGRRLFHDSRRAGDIWVIYRPSQVLPLYAIFDV